MTRGLLSAPITGCSFTGTSSPPKYQLSVGTYSGPLIPRYPCSQVTRYTEPSSPRHDTLALRGVGSDWEILASLGQSGQSRSHPDLPPSSHEG